MSNRKPINMNHAATSASKPVEVVDALTAFLHGNSHVSAGRGEDGLEAMQTIFDCRTTLGALFGADDPSHVIFTSGATESLNIAINGLIEDGCHVLTTSLEHNAVARPLHLLQQLGRIEVTWMPCSSKGDFDPQQIAKEVRPNTRLLVMTHASNVLGNVLPVAESFALAKEYNLLTVLDAAQTAGHMEVTMDLGADAIAYTGHKGLRGIAGVGGLILNKTAADSMKVWKAGGTGSHSQSLEMPSFYPDKLEPGTRNLLGIIGLKAAAKAIKTSGFDAIRNHEKAITTRFVDGLDQLPVVVYGHYEAENWMPVISINIPGKDAGILAHRLSEAYGIKTRSGLHCSPLAHQTIGTFHEGTLRFSFGMDTTSEEIDYALGVLAEITSSAL